MDTLIEPLARSIPLARATRRFLAIHNLIGPDHHWLLRIAEQIALTRNEQEITLLHLHQALATRIETLNQR